MRRHKITFFAHRNDEAEAAACFLREHGIESVLVDRVVPAKAGPLFYARLAVNLVSPLPYSVASHSSPELRRAVVSFARDHPIDLWQAEATALVDLLDDLHGAPGLIVAHNVESLIWKRYHDTEPNPFKKWYIKQQWRKFERFERRAFARAAGVVAVSEEDSQRIQDQFGGRHVNVVDNGIDRTYFEAVQPDPDCTRSFSWAASTGVPTWTRWICSWTGSFRQSAPRSRRPGFSWSVGNLLNRCCGVWRGWTVSSCTPTSPMSGRSWPVAA